MTPPLPQNFTSPSTSPFPRKQFKIFNNNLKNKILPNFLFCNKVKYQSSKTLLERHEDRGC